MRLKSSLAIAKKRRNTTSQIHASTMKLNLFFFIVFILPQLHSCHDENTEEEEGKQKNLESKFLFIPFTYFVFIFSLCEENCKLTNRDKFCLSQNSHRNPSRQKYPYFKYLSVLQMFGTSNESKLYKHFTICFKCTNILKRLSCLTCRSSCI